MEMNENLSENVYLSAIKAWKDVKLNRMGLTIKEREVAELLLKGLSNKELANTLGNTEKTMKHHVATIYKKAKVETRSKFFASIFGL